MVCDRHPRGRRWTPITKAGRDSAAIKRRLLAAATAEFAARGIAGARVDRIAAAAQANKRQIYDYFGDKDGLFDAVLETHIGAIIDATLPVDPDDLPAYAGRLFDYHTEHPELVRLLQWAGLEGRSTPTAYARRLDSYRRRLAAIEAAQRRRSGRGHLLTSARLGSSDEEPRAVLDWRLSALMP
jgi:AcrR family transcriptional regulator